MHLLRLVFFVMALACSGNAENVLVLFADPDDKAVRIASLKLQLELEENAALNAPFARHGLRVVTRRYGRFHALTVQPIRSAEARIDMKLALGSRYPGMFFVENTVRHRSPASSAAHRQAERPKPIMHAIDWVWLMIFLLALTGLIASVIQRKKIFTFKKEQTRFRDNQTQMDQEIETLQGEKHE